MTNKCLYSIRIYRIRNDTTGTYDGAVPSQSNAFGTLTFYPDGNTCNNTASIDLPFFDGGWWSVQGN